MFCIFKLKRRLYVLFICNFGYYLDSNGVWLSFIDKIEINPNCERVPCKSSTINIGNKVKTIDDAMPQKKYINDKYLMVFIINYVQNKQYYVKNYYYTAAKTSGIIKFLIILEKLLKINNIIY